MNLDKQEIYEGVLVDSILSSVESSILLLKKEAKKMKAGKWSKEVKDLNDELETQILNAKKLVSPTSVSESQWKRIQTLLSQLNYRYSRAEREEIIKTVIQCNDGVLPAIYENNVTPNFEGLLIENLMASKTLSLLLLLEKTKDLKKTEIPSEIKETSERMKEELIDCKNLINPNSLTKNQWHRVSNLINAFNYFGYTKAEREAMIRAKKEEQPEV